MPVSALLPNDPTALASRVDTKPSPNVGQELESLFVSLLLKEMRQAGVEGGLFPGDASDTFGGMFDLYLGNFIAESGGIGLSRNLQSIVK